MSTDLRFTDVTLCTLQKGEASFKEKLEIAKLLDKIGVVTIEIPASEDSADRLFIKTVSAAIRHTAVAVVVPPSEEKIKEALAALEEAKEKIIKISVPVSPVQMEYTCHKKGPAMLEAVKKACAFASSVCDQVEFSAEDATRAEPEFLTQIITAAVESGVKTVTVNDDAGVMLPNEIGEFVSNVKKVLPENVNLGVRCVNVMKMAVADVLAAISAGADEIKGSICGEGGYADITALYDVLQLRTDLTDRSYALRGMKIKRNGIMIKRMIKDGKNEKAVAERASLPEDMGTWELKGKDTLADVTVAVKKLGYDLSREDMAKVYEAFLNFAEKKNVGPKELDAIVASYALQVPPTYQIQSYVINSGNVINATANIRMEYKGEVLTAVGMGDGPIDAAFITIEQIVGHHYELDDFQIRSVTEGREAMGEAFIKLRSGGKIYSGRGISTDIVGASVRAYVNALNKIVYEEQ